MKYIFRKDSDGAIFSVKTCAEASTVKVFHSRLGDWTQRVKGTLAAKLETTDDGYVVHMPAPPACGQALRISFDFSQAELLFILLKELGEGKMLMKGHFKPYE